jgi:hypothetical protein
VTQVAGTTCQNKMKSLSAKVTLFCDICESAEVNVTLLSIMDGVCCVDEITG